MIRYNARWVLPVATPPLEHATVGVEGDRIAYVGPRVGAPLGADVELGDVLLLPGLVNAHCHLELTVMRGFLEDLDFRRWILRLTTAKRAVLERESLLDSARLGIEEGLRAGITTYADTCDSGVVLHAMSEAGVRGIMYQEVFGPDPSQCETSMAGLRDKIGALRPFQTPLVRLGISPHAPYTVSDDLFRAAAKLSRDQSLPMAIHIAEGELEERLVVHADGKFAEGLRTRGMDVRPRGSTPIALLAGLEVLDVAPLLIHCVRVNETDIATIAHASCPVAHCPASNAKLGHGIAPLTELLAAGVVVGLGSDSMASNNRMDLLEEARLALLAQRARLGSPETPSAQEVLELATIGGARALGLDAEIGTLEVGKSADLAAFASAPTFPVLDPISAAVFSVTGARATFVSVAGRPLVRDGRLLSPIAGLSSRVQSTAETLARWLATDGELMVPV